MDNYYCGMTRKQLQAECKKRGIPANKSNLQMAKLLSSILQVDENEISEVIQAPEESDSIGGARKRVKKVRFSPEVETREYEPSAYRRKGRRRGAIVNGVPNEAIQDGEGKVEGKKDSEEGNGVPLRRSKRNGARKATEKFVECMVGFPVNRKRKSKGDEKMEDEIAGDKPEKGAKKDEVTENIVLAGRRLRGREVVIGENGHVGRGDSFVSRKDNTGRRSWKRRKGGIDEGPVSGDVSEANASLEEDTKSGDGLRRSKRIANKVGTSALSGEESGKAEIACRNARLRAKVKLEASVLQNKTESVEIGVGALEAETDNAIVEVKKGGGGAVQLEKILKPLSRNASRRKSVALQKGKLETDEPERRMTREQLKNSCLEVASEVNASMESGKIENVSLPVIHLRRSQRNTITFNCAIADNGGRTRVAVERLKMLPETFSGEYVHVNDGSMKPEISDGKRKKTAGNLGKIELQKRKNERALKKEPPMDIGKSMIVNPTRRFTRLTSGSESSKPSEPHKTMQEKKERKSNLSPVIDEATLLEKISPVEEPLAETIRLNISEGPVDVNQLSFKYRQEDVVSVRSIYKSNGKMRKDSVDAYAVHFNIEEALDGAMLPEEIIATMSPEQADSIGQASSDGGTLLEETVAQVPKFPSEPTILDETLAPITPMSVGASADNGISDSVNQLATLGRVGVVVVDYDQTLKPIVEVNGLTMSEAKMDTDQLSLTGGKEVKSSLTKSSSTHKSHEKRSKDFVDVSAVNSGVEVVTNSAMLSVETATALSPKLAGASTSQVTLEIVCEPATTEEGANGVTRLEETVALASVSPKLLGASTVRKKSDMASETAAINEETMDNAKVLKETEALTSQEWAAASTGSEALVFASEPATINEGAADCTVGRVCIAVEQQPLLLEENVAPVLPESVEAPSDQELAQIASDPAMLEERKLVGASTAKETSDTVSKPVPKKKADVLVDNKEEFIPDNLVKGDSDSNSCLPLKIEFNFDDCKSVELEHTDCKSKVCNEISVPDGYSVANGLNISGLCKETEREQSIRKDKKLYSSHAIQIPLNEDGVYNSEDSQPDIATDGSDHRGIPHNDKIPATVAIVAFANAEESFLENFNSLHSFEMTASQVAQHKECLFHDYSSCSVFDVSSATCASKLQEGKYGGSEECLDGNVALQCEASVTVSTLSEQSVGHDQGENQLANQNALLQDDLHIIERADVVSPELKRDVSYTCGTVIGIPDKEMATSNCEVETRDSDVVHDVLPQSDLEQLEDERDSYGTILEIFCSKSFLHHDFGDLDANHSSRLLEDRVNCYCDKAELQDESVAPNYLHLQSQKVNGHEEMVVERTSSINDMTDVSISSLFVANKVSGKAMDGEPHVEKCQVGDKDSGCAQGSDNHSGFNKVPETVHAGSQSSYSPTILQDGEASAREKVETITNSVNDSHVADEGMVFDKTLEGEYEAERFKLADSEQTVVQNTVVKSRDLSSYEADGSLTLACQKSECFMVNNTEPEASKGEKSKLLVKGTTTEDGDLKVDSFAPRMEDHLAAGEALEACKYERAHEDRHPTATRLIMRELGGGSPQLNDLEESCELSLGYRDQFSRSNCNPGSGASSEVVSTDDEELDKTLLNSTVGTKLEPAAQVGEVGDLEGKNLLELDQNAFLSSENLAPETVKPSAKNNVDRMDGNLKVKETKDAADSPHITSVARNDMVGECVLDGSCNSGLKLSDPGEMIDAEADIAGAVSNGGKICFESEEERAKWADSIPSLPQIKWDKEQCDRNSNNQLSAETYLGPTELSISADATSDLNDLFNGNSTTTEISWGNEGIGGQCTQNSFVTEELHLNVLVDGCGEEFDDHGDTASEAAKLNTNDSPASTVLLGDGVEDIPSQVGSTLFTSWEVNLFQGSGDQVHAENAGREVLKGSSSSKDSADVVQLIGSDPQYNEADCSNVFAAAASSNREKKTVELNWFTGDGEQNGVKELDAQISSTMSTSANAANGEQNLITTEQAAPDLMGNFFEGEQQVEQKDCTTTPDIDHENHGNEFAKLESCDVSSENVSLTKFAEVNAFLDPECDSNNLKDGTFANINAQDAVDAMELCESIPKVEASTLDASSALTSSTVDKGNVAADERSCQLKLPSPERATSFAKKEGSEILFAKRLSYSAVERKVHRTGLIPGTPQKVLYANDMKENAPSIKGGEIGSMTELKASKRRPLKDLRNEV